PQQYNHQLTSHRVSSLLYPIGKLFRIMNDITLIITRSILRLDRTKINQVLSAPGQQPDTIVKKCFPAVVVIGVK
ncbi:MAG: hypothetical protein PVH98_06620, partial [Gammaproteobacteria bacterium]